MTEPTQTPGSEKDSANSQRSWTLLFARYSLVAVALPASTIVGWLLGVGADRFFHTTWLYMAGLVFGIVAGFVGLLRTISSAESGAAGKQS